MSGSNVFVNKLLLLAGSGGGARTVTVRPLCGNAANARISHIGTDGRSRFALKFFFFSLFRIVHYSPLVCRFRGKDERNLQIKCKEKSHKTR